MLEMYKFFCYKIKLLQMKVVLQYFFQLLYLCWVLGLFQFVDVGLYFVVFDQVVVVGGLYARVQGLNFLGLGRYFFLELAFQVGVFSFFMDQFLTNFFDFVFVCYG